VTAANIAMAVMLRYIQQNKQNYQSVSQGVYGNNFVYFAKHLNMTAIAMFAAVTAV